MTCNLSSGSDFPSILKLYLLSKNNFLFLLLYLLYDFKPAEGLFLLCQVFYIRVKTLQLLLGIMTFIYLFKVFSEQLSMMVRRMALGTVWQAYTT